MSKPKRINLNDYERVEKESDLEGYQSVILTPLKVKVGDEWMQPQDLYFRKPESERKFVETPVGAVWYKDVPICTKGSKYDYTKLVHWWYDNALKDPEFKAIINDTYAKNGFRVNVEVEKMKTWLVRQPQSSRKSHLYMFTNKWLNRNYNKHLDYMKKR